MRGAEWPMRGGKARRAPRRACAGPEVPVDKIRAAMQEVVVDDGSGIPELRRPFYPLLKPSEWAEQAREAGVLVRPLALDVALPARTPVVRWPHGSLETAESRRASL